MLSIYIHTIQTMDLEGGERDECLWNCEFGQCVLFIHPDQAFFSFCAPSTVQIYITNVGWVQHSLSM